MSKKVRKIITNIRVGKPDVKPDASAHIKGVRQGNEPGSLEKQEGIIWKPDARIPDTQGLDSGGIAIATARRSTGIAPEDSDPIDPKMPTLTPA